MRYGDSFIFYQISQNAKSKHILNKAIITKLKRIIVHLLRYLNNFLNKVSFWKGTVIQNYSSRLFWNKWNLLSLQLFLDAKWKFVITFRFTLWTKWMLSLNSEMFLNFWNSITLSYKGFSELQMSNSIATFSRPAEGRLRPKVTIEGRAYMLPNFSYHLPIKIALSDFEAQVYMLPSFL